MSIYDNNPFSYKASNKNISDNQFLSLFEPQALDLLINFKNSLWQNPIEINSVPGSGKTTFLRLFTPESLVTLYQNRNDEIYNELFKKLSEFNIFNTKGPKKLGIYTSMANYYLIDSNHSLNEAMRNTIFFSLLMSRLVISFLKGLCILSKINYPSELSDIKILNIANLNPESGIPINCTGEDLFLWASKMEKQALDLNIYGFSKEKDELRFPHFLEILNLFVSPYYLYNKRLIFETVLIMLDEVDTLTNNQITILSRFLIKNRVSNWWLSKRIEALDKAEIFKHYSGTISKKERDFETINLDDYWYNNKKLFNKIVKSIANRRIKEYPQKPLSRFSLCLQNNLSTDTWMGIYDNLKKRIIPKIENIDSLNNIYKKKIPQIEKELKKSQKSTKNIYFEKSKLLRTIEILYDRKIRGSFQTTLIDNKINDEEIRGIPSNIGNAAVMKICFEEQLPYYFGIDRVVQIASNNIEQFLYICEKLFDEYLTKNLLREHSVVLTPDIQESIIKHLSNDFLQRNILNLANEIELQNLVDAIGKLSKIETDKPNAPYAPGVNGVAISLIDVERLNRENVLTRSDDKKLRSILHSCLSSNILEQRQVRCKGSDWLVLYLNRLLCVRFGLPLDYGGYREVSLRTLQNWTKYGFTMRGKGG
ncbi:MAG: hypothetical protein JXA54_13420 [Candidatus Heimdallarchaeota archaeon]|nr:hypothetical protein [Candidatus Heimdallarchaeota archaeon]